MKYLNLNRIAVIAFLGSFLLIACKNQNELGCPMLVDGRPPLTIALELKNTQNRDLLNPATTGHYDTAQIRQLNNGLLYAIRQVPGGTNYRMIYKWQSGQNTNIIKLSATDQDTITTNIETIKSDCSSIDNFKGFDYNGKAYVDSAAMSMFKKFIIIK